MKWTTTKTTMTRKHKMWRDIVARGIIGPRTFIHWKQIFFFSFSREEENERMEMKTSFSLISGISVHLAGSSANAIWPSFLALSLSTNPFKSCYRKKWNNNNYFVLVLHEFGGHIHEASKKWRRRRQQQRACTLQSRYNHLFVHILVELCFQAHNDKMSFK